VSDDKPTILYPFRLRDSLTGKWRRARWKASAQEIAEHNGEWVIDGPAEVYGALGLTSDFMPRQAPPEPVRLVMHPQREMPPAIDKLERFLALVFLRRHVTYCIRRRQFAQAQGAAALWREMGADDERIARAQSRCRRRIVGSAT
jgi:hypothetical protein